MITALPLILAAIALCLTVGAIGAAAEHLARRGQQ